MTNEQYQEAVKRTDKDLGSLEKNITHMVLGITSECGELADILKRKIAYEKEMDHINEKEELGDLLWYIANYCNHRGFTLSECMDTNISKLYVRYPNQFSEFEALNRNLQQERSILEK